MHFRSWTIAAGTAIVAGSAVSVAASEARKVRCQVTYAARDLQLRLLQQTLADDELRTEIFPGVSRVHVGINGWVMYHQLMLRSGAESWERFELMPASCWVRRRDRLTGKRPGRASSTPRPAALTSGSCALCRPQPNVGPTPAWLTLASRRSGRASHRHRRLPHARTPRITHLYPASPRRSTPPNLESQQGLPS